MTDRPPIVEVNVALTVAPAPSVLAPDLPDPDIMPKVWRIASRDIGAENYHWLYVERGTNTPEIEWVLCEQHKELLDVCPPDEGELKRMRELGVLE